MVQSVPRALSRFNVKRLNKGREIGARAVGARAVICWTEADLSSVIF